MLFNLGNKHSSYGTVVIYIFRSIFDFDVTILSLVGMVANQMKTIQNNDNYYYN